MKSKTFVSFVMMVGLLSAASCDSDGRQRTARPDLDLLMRNEVQAILQNELGMFIAGGNSSAISQGGPMGFWFYPPWMYYGVSGGAAGSADATVTYTDTSYYDPETGYWVYQYGDSTFQWQWRYKFLPHDNEGYPTAETDQYVFDASYSGQFDDPYWGASYSYSGQSNYQISGMKDWADSSKIGTIVFNGTSGSQFTQQFAEDTSVSFSYDEIIDRVTMKEDGCSPSSGAMNFTMIQDAVPDSFVFIYRYDDSTAFEMPYKDFTYTGQTIFTEDGVRYIIDGEEYFYEVQCDSGYVTLGRSAKLKLR